MFSLAEARALTFFLWPPLLCRLAITREVLAHWRGKTEVLVFNLAAVAKALAQFEHSLEAVGLMLTLRLCLRLEGYCFTFGPSESAALPSNMVDASHYQLVFLATGGCYDSS